VKLAQARGMEPLAPDSGKALLSTTTLGEGNGRTLADSNQRSAQARLAGLPVLLPAHRGGLRLVERGDPIAVRLDTEPQGPGVVPGVEQLGPDQVTDQGVGERAVRETAEIDQPVPALEVSQQPVGQAAGRWPAALRPDLPGPRNPPRPRSGSYGSKIALAASCRSDPWR
jgi:hypothetical protein